MDSLLHHLRQRKLVQWGLAYLAAGWVVLQVIDVVGDKFGWPVAVFRAATVLLAGGLAAVIVVAWYHGDRGSQRITAVEGLILVAILLAAGAGVAVVSGEGKGGGLSLAEGEAAERSVAVLPFVNMSGERENEYFSDGITEEILNTLAAVPELRVPARTSSFSFKGKNLPTSEIARALRVATVLEGSVRRVGDSVRISTRLVDARSDRPLWSEQYDRDVKDVLAVQTEIARSIAQKLDLTLREGVDPQRRGTRDPVAYDLYLRGLHAMNSGLRYDEARDHFEQSVSRDSSFALAHAALSDACAQLNEPARAKTAALTAVRLGEALPEAHAALGYVLFFHEWNWPAARRELDRALALRPAYPDALQRLAYAYNALGRGDAAVAAIDRAHALDPLSFRLEIDRGIIYSGARRNEQAVRQWRKVLQLQPGSLMARRNLGGALLELGRRDEALREFEAVGDSLNLALLAGDTARAIRLVERRERRPDADPLGLAMSFARVGMTDRALAWLDSARVQRHRLLALHVQYSAFDGMRSDPRFARYQKLVRTDP